MLDKRKSVHERADSVGVPVDGVEPDLLVQHSESAAGEVASGPQPLVQLAAVAQPVAGAARDAAAAAAARTALPAHAVQAAQGPPVGARLRGHVRHHGLLPSTYTYSFPLFLYTHIDVGFFLPRDSPSQSHSALYTAPVNIFPI